MDAKPLGATKRSQTSTKSSHRWRFRTDAAAQVSLGKLLVGKPYRLLGSDTDGVGRSDPGLRYRRMKFAHVLAAAALAAFPSVALAQSALPATAPSEATLSVPGDGLVQRSPDLARVALTIVTDDGDAARSAGKNTTILNAVKAKLAPLGIAGDAVRTSFFNVEFVPNPPKNLPPEQRQPRYGYITTRSLTVDVSPIENAGKVVDAATSAGVTSVGGVSFDLRDRKSAYRQALQAALNDAKASAAALAQGGDFHLVRIVRIASGGANPIRPLPVAEGFNARLAAAPAPPPTEIGPNGPIDVSAHVELTYEIR